jgi:Flp pilus assembly protein TadD
VFGKSWKSKHRVLPHAALVSLTLLAYLPALSAGYIWDDGAYVQYNSTLRSLDGLRQIWFELGATQDYYPATFTTFWLEYQLWGVVPAGYHLSNVLLHALNAVLLANLLTRLRVPGAWFAAAIFALHPVHVESVAWITERKNVLSGLFFLLSLYAYLISAGIPAEKPSTSERRWYYAASLCCFLLAMLSKTVTVTLPFVLPVIVWWQRGKFSWRDLAQIVPYLALALPIFGASTLSGANFGGAGVPIAGAEHELWNHTLLERFLIAGRVIWFYAGKLLLPWELSFVYPRWEIDRSVWWQYLFPLTAFSVPIGFLLMSRRWGRGPAAAVLFFGLTLGPASGFFNFYFQRYSFVADHLQYLASTGLIGLTAAIGAAVLQRVSSQIRMLVQGAAAVVLLLLGLLTFQQCLAYQDLESLWEDTLRKNPNCEMAHTNLGLLLREQNRLDEALAHFQKSRELAPRDANIYNNLGTVLLARGDVSAAIEQFQHALQLDPQFAEAISNLGLAYLAQEREQEGLEALRQAVHLVSVLQKTAPKKKSWAANIHFNLAAALHERHQFDEAQSYYLTVIKLNPRHAAAHYNLSAIYEQQGRATKAAEHRHKAQQIQADFP